MKYTVLLQNGTVGTIDSDTINGQHAEAFMGETVTVDLYDENGFSIEVEGKLVDVLEENEY
jgi:hypothetical protein